MKKVFLSILIIVSLCSYPAFAASYAEEEKSLNTLKKVQLISEDYIINGNVTRLEAITLLMNMDCGKNSLDIEYDFAKKVLEIYDDADLLNETETCIVGRAVYLGYVKGAFVEGKLRIQPYSELSWREALILILRLTNRYFEDLYTDAQNKDEFIVSSAKNRGFIDVYDTEKLDKFVTRKDWCVLANIVLHTPINRHGYYGEYTAYYIDDYISD